MPFMTLPAARMAAALAAVLGSLAPAFAPAFADEALTAKIQAIADAYVADTAPGEKATGVSISVSLPDDGGTVNVVSGKVSNAPDAADITPATLFQIGSITKSMTSTVLLQLQSEGVLDLDDTLGTWLPEYPAWKDVPIRQLLNMTSTIPGYDKSDAMIDDVAKHGFGRHYSPAVLVGFADPTYPGAPAATSGYDYSNTNYILAGMVIEKATGQTVQETFEDRLFGPRYGMADTHYRAGVYPTEITDRMASGYFPADGTEAMKALDGRDVKTGDMSWGGAAGAAVSSPEQVGNWVRALFGSEELLDADARAELVQVVSMQTGQPVPELTADDPHGFGLGVSGLSSSVLGKTWQYEGESMGFRTLYVYLPERDLVVTLSMNSGAEGDADHAGKVALAIIQAVEGE
jgi:D-alanyl-D-alanine carboxypeptidase